MTQDLYSYITSALKVKSTTAYHIQQPFSMATRLNLILSQVL